MSVAAWERFLRDEPAPDVEPEILASWMRSRQAGVNSEAAVFHAIPEHEVARRLAVHSGHVGTIAPHLIWLSETMANIDHAMCVVDEDGIVLWGTGMPALIDRLRLSRGFDWSEGRMGTNGAGTALAASHPVVIRNGQHYCRAWHDLTGIGVPIVDPFGDRLGALDLVTTTDHVDAERLRVLRHIGHAVQRELALVHAEAGARRLRVRAERMRDAVGALSRALSPDAVVDALIHQGLVALQAIVGVVWVLSEDETHLSMVGSADLVRAPPASYTTIPVAAKLAVTETIRTGRLTLIESSDEHARIAPDAPADPRPGIGSRACIPLAMHGRTIGVLAIAIRDWRSFDDEDRVLMLELGDHCAHALERARSYAAERSARASAERAAVARDELLELVSHHLRSPLARVTTSSEILAELVEAQAPREQVIQHSNQIHDAARSMSALVRNLLDAGRLDAGSLRVSRQAVPITELLGEIVETLETSARLRRQHIALRCDEALVVSCDRELTAVALSNLAENALKFSPDGTTITIRAHREGSRAHICVIDEGPGIDEHELPRVFERYYQIGGTRREGVGLGLYLARTLIESQSGAIRAGSRIGHGSEFCCELLLEQ